MEDSCLICLSCWSCGPNRESTPQRYCSKRLPTNLSELVPLFNQLAVVDTVVRNF